MTLGLVWWHKSGISTFERCRLETQEFKVSRFEASLDMKLHLKKPKQQQNQPTLLTRDFSMKFYVKNYYGRYSVYVTFSVLRDMNF